ncbi:MAG: hypothetical protein ACWIPI_09515 [Polaribacter sp.]
MKNSRKTKNENIKIIDIDENLRQFKESEMSQAKTDGENISANHPPLDKESLQNLPTLQKIYTGFNSKAAEMAAIFHKILEQFFTENQQAVADFNSSETSEAKAALKDLEQEEKEAIEEAIVSHDETITEQKESRVQIKGNIKNLKSTLRSLKSHTLWPAFLIGGILILSILAGEVILNSEIFEYAGYSRDYSRIIGISMATGTFILGISLSFTFKSDWKKTIKGLVSLAIIALICGVYYTLGSIRVSLMSAEANSDGLFGLTPFHFMVFNLAFFSAIFAIKFFIFPSAMQVKENNLHREVSKKLKLEEKKENKAKSEVRGAHKSREETKKIVKKDFEPRISEVKNKIIDTSARIKSSAVAFNEKLSTARGFYTQVNNDYKTVASTLFATINLYRNDEVSLPIPELKNLENPFSDYEPIPTFNGTEPKTK